MAIPSNLYDLAHILLSAIEVEFAADSVPIPARRYVTAFEPVAECDSLIVSFDRLYVGVPGLAETPVPVRHNASRVAKLKVWIMRCLAGVPLSEGVNMVEAAPPVDALEADANVVLTDAYTLVRAITRAHFNGSELRGLCEAVSVGPCVPFVGGGIGGVSVEVDLELS